MGTYDDFNSPYGVSRSIHPGAVLLSPQLSSTSTPTGTITNNNNNNSTSGTSGTTNINNLSNAFNNMNIMNNSSTTTHTDVSNISNTLIDDTNNNNTNNYNYNNDNHNINIHNNNNDINNNNNNNIMTAGSVSNNNNNNNTKNNGLINLTQDINNICKWLTNMSSAQQNMVMDNIISTLKDDVLQYTKLKLDSLTNSGYLSSPPQPPIITSPLSVPLLNELNNNNNLPPSSSSNSTNMNSILNNEHTTTSTTTNNNINKDTIYHPWSPQPILEQQQARILHQRPKSAYPTNYQFQQNNDIGMISTLSQQTLRNENHSGPHLNIHNNSNYTNNGNSNYTNNGNSNYTNNGNSNYTNNNNSNYTNNNTTSYNTNNNMNTSPNQYQQHVSYNRSLNNRKIYSDSQYQQPYSYQSTGLHSYNNFYSFTKAHQNKHRHTDDSNNNLQHSHHQQQQQQQQKSPANTSMNPKNLTDPILLLDIPMWLKSLRLHKYSTILKDYYWEDLIELDDDFLNKKGVVALGARRKLLKAFTIVKDLKNKGEIDQKAFNSTH